MNPLLSGGLIIVISVVLFASGMPIAFALAITALIAILIFLGPEHTELFGKLTFDSLNDFGLLAIPLFVLMGNLFGGSKASRQLFVAGEAWLSRIRGGLAMSSIVASTVFAAMTGSSPATAAAIGRVAIPEMQARGYSARIATGAVAAGGTLGILIPPSVTLILYGIASEQSIGQLFAAGIIPGIVVMIMFCIWIYIAVTRDQKRLSAEQSNGETSRVIGMSEDGPTTWTWGERFAALVKVLPFGALVAAVLFVLYRGIATPSEAAAIGVILVALLVIVFYREHNGKELLGVLQSSVSQSSMILMITAFSAVIATVLSYLEVPQELASTITGLELNRWAVLILINIVLLAMGLFLPPVSIVVMVTPILLPLILELGFDPIWFGIVMTINMEMGLITPPVGLNLFVIKGIAPKIKLTDILAGSAPYIVVLGLAIVLFSIFPEIVTWLPEVLYKE